MLFGGSHLGFGIVIGPAEEELLRNKFATDSSISEIVEHDLTPLIIDELRKGSHLKGNDLFQDFRIKDGTFLMLSTSSYSSYRDDNFTPIQTDWRGNEHVLHINVTDTVEIFKKSTGIEKEWTWAIISDFY